MHGHRACRSAEVVTSCGTHQSPRRRFPVFSNGVQCELFEASWVAVLAQVAVMAVIVATIALLPFPSIKAQTIIPTHAGRGHFSREQGMRTFFRGISTLAISILIATPITLSAQQSGGPQSGFGFGGSGIPNNYVITNTNAGTVGFTLGLSATGRCSGNPQVCGATVTNDGASTFFAATGAPFTGQGHPGYASWNFDFGVLGSTTGYTFDLLYGMNGGPLGTWLLGTDLMDSENLGFAFLNTGFPGVVTPPAGWTGFDPSANAQYNFELVALNSSGVVGASVYECVDAGTNQAACSAPGSNVVPEPGTLGMLATGLVGMMGAGLRRRKRTR